MQGNFYGAAVRAGLGFGEGLLTPPIRATEGLLGMAVWTGARGDLQSSRVARSGDRPQTEETGHNVGRLWRAILRGVKGGLGRPSYYP